MHAVQHGVLFFFSLVYELIQGDDTMFKRVYYTLRTLLQHPRYWRGILACPHAEPLHYHHDGCPACYDASMSRMIAVMQNDK